MKCMGWSRKALSMSVAVALLVTYSMVAMASAGNAAGELTVIGGSSTGETSFVTVNGEAAKSGRTVFSSSTISTPEGMGAILNFGKAGKIQLAPNTVFTVSADGKSISGDLSAGSLTVLNAAQSVPVTISTGEIVNVNAGETASANSGNASKKPTPRIAGINAWVFAAIVGGVIAAVIIATTAGNNDVPVLSPVR